MKKTNLFSLILLTSATFFACNKEKEAEIPPEMQLKTGAGYVSTNLELEKNVTFKVGVVVTKTEDDLKSFNVSYAYDGAFTTTSFQNTAIPDASRALFDTDVELQTRNVAGVETWYFTVTDVDGNVVQKSLALTVK